MARPDSPLTGTQAHAHFITGKQIARDEVLQILEALPFRWDGDKQTITLSKPEVIALVDKELNK